ncbi:hypothetical protein U9M48_013536 [Paspalum notatum var. saurae]|uniref:Uncharacterized protein n=1 Tax=Paspalum notatum var. saurae TaxID=547442 RepID=A0AAQ3T041_PASNO
MPGVPRELAEHQLKVFPNAKPIKQRLRRFTLEKAELTRLKTAGFIREVMHPEWLANPVLVLKKNKKDWRMCVDYTDLNKHCPKDPFGLPRIDQPSNQRLGENSIHHAFRCLLLYLNVFRVKERGSNGERVEAYVDDVVIKTKNEEDFIDDLRQVFDCLKKFRWKLNPTKCIFGVPAGQLPGFVISNRGIMANPKKIKAILRMHPPRSQKDAQRLTGCMAALSRFISRLGKRGMPFYKLLKKVDRFQWTAEAQKALDSLKKFLTSTPVLKSPNHATADSPAEDLLLYISCMTHVISTALVVERPDGQHTVPRQHPVYFISEVLSPSKIRYPQVQKLPIRSSHYRTQTTPLL